ncbi:hypothetical protein AVEN_219872-1, partial [Araneus ventricosus]
MDAYQARVPSMFGAYPHGYGVYSFPDPLFNVRMPAPTDLSFKANSKAKRSPAKKT